VTAVVNFTVLEVVETEAVSAEIPRDVRCLTRPAPNVALLAKCLSNPMAEKKYSAVNVLAK